MIGARIAERPQRRRMASVTVLKDTLLLIDFFYYDVCYIIRMLYTTLCNNYEEVWR